MRKVIGKILVAAVMMLAGVGAMSVPGYADCDMSTGSGCVEAGCVQTAILGSGGWSCPSTEGGADSIIENILKPVVNILTVGVLILGMIGITISGMQYLSAGGNEEQVRKSKRRIFEIVIGMAAFILMYAFLSFLIPGFNGLGG